MHYTTDKNRVLGLGSAKDGTSHWWNMRLTSIALIPLTILFVLPFAYNLGASHERVLEAYSHPINAIITLLFFVTAFKHLHDGLQEVVLDYVHAPILRNALLFANTMFCWLFGLTGIFAVLRIAL